MFSEYTIVKTKYFKRIKHPDFVVKIGLRYYTNSEKLNNSAFYMETSLGYVSYNKEHTKYKNDVIVGAGTGYKYFFSNKSYVIPRGILHCEIYNNNFLYGGEVLCGFNL